MKTPVKVSIRIIANGSPLAWVSTKNFGRYASNRRAIGRAVRLARKLPNPSTLPLQPHSGGSIERFNRHIKQPIETQANTMKTAQDHITIRRAAHHAALETLANLPSGEGVKLWRKLRRIETAANAAATAQCNGSDYNGQPFRPDWHPDGSMGTNDNPTPYEVFCDSIRARVAKTFGGELPKGFYLNQDPRGYSLKIDKERGGIIPSGMETDWGGYGILAPEIK